MDTVFTSYAREDQWYAENSILTTRLPELMYGSMLNAHFPG